MSLTKKILTDWLKAKEKLNKAKKDELSLRTEICSTILGSKIKGAEKYKNYGFIAKAEAKLNIKIEIDALKSIFKNLSKEEKACIRYKPELIAAEYKKLPPDSLLHQAVVSTQGTPALEIKPVEKG